jgi:MoaA/NifB/PqqE/SkfB family radical SAM enzyme
VARGADDGTLPAPVDKHCGAGSSGLAIDPYGNVYPCVQWRRPVGNLHERTLTEIWLDSRGLDEVRGLTVAAKGAVEASGPGGMLLNFCPGMAQSLTGDPLRIYDGAEQRRELLQEILREEDQRSRKLLPILP